MTKDLEKDEREAMLEAMRVGSLHGTLGETVWLAAKAHFEARLQQVEAERDEIAALRMSNDDRRVLLDEHRREIRAVEGERDDVGEECFKAKTELSIAREALEEIDDTYDQHGMGSPEASILRSIAVKALARLQAKEEGT